MLIFSAIAMAGFLLLLIAWLWILPEREGGSGWWLPVALCLTVFGFTGAVTASDGLGFALGAAVAAGAAAGAVGRLSKTSSGSTIR
jgi:hypothetical protein